MGDFPWPPVRDLIHVERILPTMKKSIKRWVIASKLLPVDLLAKFAKVSKQGGDNEALLLFTSGSSGEPKGVPLTHRNLLANVCQFGSRLGLSDSNASLLGCLPLFHSFGCTATLLFPIIEGIKIVSYPSPLDTKRLAELIEKNKVNFLISTPTFLRGYMRRVKPEQLASVNLVVTGAEKLPNSLADSFSKKFGITPLEGYGLTETSPATNLNIINRPTDTPEPDILADKSGSVGQFLPGVAVKITNAVTDDSCDIDQQGIIWLKGANIFPGYLNNEEKTNEVIKDGWFNTGDVGRVDDEGFLHIEGRTSRFSKIAGEMVPHETLEATVIEVLGLDEETERKVAIVGIPDEKKGEAIVLLSCVTDPQTTLQACIDLRYKLLDASIPSLWCPKEILVVNEIPILASGKLDIKGTVGSTGDFSTTATLSISIGKAVAQAALDWQKKHHTPLNLIEIGGGDGSLAMSVIKSIPFFKRFKLNYHLVDSSTPLSEEQKTKLGKKVTLHNDIISALNQSEGTAFIFSNELVDAFPVRVFQHCKNRTEWHELYIHEDQELLRPYLDTLPDSCAFTDYEYSPNQRIEIHESYKDWLTHQRITGNGVYLNPGKQDITADVNFTDLMLWAEQENLTNLSLSTQEKFLRPEK